MQKYISCPPLLSFYNHLKLYFFFSSCSCVCIVAVPGPPVIIWFPEVSYTLAEIVWEPPLEPNGIITGYMVSYRLRDSGKPLINSTVLTPNTTKYTVGNLEREAYYEFRVTAKTRLGWGETADVEVYTMINRRKYKQIKVVHSFYVMVS